MLLGAEQPVAGITQTRDDVAVVVEMAVDRGGVDLHVVAALVDLVDALRGSDENEQA